MNDVSRQPFSETKNNNIHSTIINTYLQHFYSPMLDCLPVDPCSEKCTHSSEFHHSSFILFGGRGDLHHEARAAAGRTGGGQVTAQQPGQLARDRQAQPSAPRGGRRWRCRPACKVGTVPPACPRRFRSRCPAHETTASNRPRTPRSVAGR